MAGVLGISSGEMYIMYIIIFTVHNDYEIEIM